MDRQIKFRIYNRKTKEWIHPPGYEDNLFGEIILLGAFLDKVSIKDLNDIEALQYTGAKINGVEIYEGDIIDTIKDRYLVEYDCFRTEFMGKALFHDSRTFDLQYVLPSGILLGNKYDNADLLTPIP